MTSIFYHPYCKPFYRHPIESIKCFFISLKWAYQRVKKGYCDRDLIFGVENWLLEMLPDMVDEVKKEKGTVPWPFYDEAVVALGLDPVGYWGYCESDLYEKYCKRVEADAERRWDDILTRISFLFRESAEWQCTKPNPYEEEFFRACDDRKNGVEIPGLDELENRYYDEERALDAYREECKKEATELLIKWVRHLEI